MAPETKKSPAEQATREAAITPSKDDLHEQREPEQTQEAVVTAPRPPQQSQIDQERSDWEGMGQSQVTSDADIKPSTRKRPDPIPPHRP